MSARWQQAAQARQRARRGVDGALWVYAVGLAVVCAVLAWVGRQ